MGSMFFGSAVGVSAAEITPNATIKSTQVAENVSASVPKAVSALESGSITSTSGNTSTRVYCNAGTVAVSLDLRKSNGGTCTVFLYDARNHLSSSSATVSSNGGTMTVNLTVSSAGTYAVYFSNVAGSRTNPLNYTLYSIRNV